MDIQAQWTTYHMLLIIGKYYAKKILNCQCEPSRENTLFEFLLLVPLCSMDNCSLISIFENLITNYHSV